MVDRLIDKNKRAYLREELISVFFPRRCPVCGDIVMPKGELICAGCIGKLSFVRQPACVKCGKEVDGSGQIYCPDCLRHPRSFEFGMPLLNYTEAAKKSVTAIKYKNKREYLDFYAKAVCMRHGRRIKSLQADALVPVPVHSSRLRQRGYNQAEELARRIGCMLQIPVRDDILFRRKKTLPQKELNPTQRLHNLSQAFAAAGEVPERLILVDDIYTTGSTAEACSRALKKNGAKQVWLLTLCIGKKD